MYKYWAHVKACATMTQVWKVLATNHVEAYF